MRMSSVISFIEQNMQVRIYEYLSKDALKKIRFQYIQHFILLLKPCRCRGATPPTWAGF